MNKKIKRRFITGAGLFAVVGLILGITLTSETPKEYRRDRVVTNTVTTGVAPGVKEIKQITRDDNGANQIVSYITEFDTVKNPSIKGLVGYKNMNHGKEGMATVRDQATIAQGLLDGEFGAGSKTIVSAVNSGPFNMATGRQWTTLVHKGVEYIGYEPGESTPFFAFMKDGSPYFGLGRDEYYSLRDNIEEATNGMFPLIYQGTSYAVLANIPSDDSSWHTWLAPRTGIGYTADGKIYTAVFDGRNPPISVGATYAEMMETFFSLGCTNAFALDGGGSTTLLNRIEGDSSLALRNIPSDGGERNVGSSILFYVDTQYDGAFDHANIYPKNEYYTPSSEVSFTAGGVDTAGGPAKLPEGSSWTISDPAAGTIDPVTGLFTASSTYLGKVDVKLVDVTSQELGSASIYIQNPDTLVFANSQVSLGFDADFDIALKAFYKNIQVNIKPSDIVSALKPEEAGRDPADIGVINDFILHTHPSNSINGTLEVNLKSDPTIKTSLFLIIGAKPQLIDGFEEYKSNIELVGGEVDGVPVPAKWKPYEVHPGSGSAELATYDQGSPVRFGNNSLRINYNFTSLGVTSGAGVGPSEAIEIEGAPTALGMWVYATESDQGFWLRALIKDSTGTNQNIDLTCQPSTCVNGEKPGINWTGWKYIEGLIKPEWSLPLSFAPGQTVRFMYVPGIGMGTPTSGQIYVDNIQFVYGANTDDVLLPTIDEMTINNHEIDPGETLNTNVITVSARFHDEEHIYSTGIDHGKIKIFIDGIEYSKASYLNINPDMNTMSLSGLQLNNGYHTVKLVVPDNFGNEATNETNFFIQSKVDLPSIDSVSDDTIRLKQDYKIDLYVTNGGEIDTAQLIVQLSKLFQDVDVQTLYNIGIKKELNGGTVQLKLDFDFSNAINLPKERTLFATISIKNNSNSIDASTVFSVSSTQGVINLKPTSEIVLEENESLSFALEPFSKTIEYKYIISCDPIISNHPGQKIRIFVANVGGGAAKGVSLYIDDELIGTTDDRGYVVIDNIYDFNQTQSISMYAKLGDDYSFETKSFVVLPYGDVTGKPTLITSNLVESNSKTKNISWMSNPLFAEAKAQVRYILASDYNQNPTDFKVVEGNSVLRGFYGYPSSPEKNAGALVNTVRLPNLFQGSDYLYQVGDGNIWSDLRSFKTTKRAKEETNFFVVGDNQSADMTNINQIFDRLKTSGIDYDFGIQTGDLIDNVTRVDQWEATMNAFGQVDDSKNIGNIDMMHVIGNHELYGDETGQYSKQMFGVTDLDHYSMVIGNVYIATITYQPSEAEVIDAFDWLVKDSAKYKTQYKILTMHQPPYYTNPTGGNSFVNKYGPAAIDKAGIDVVFSGHDHVYARTKPMTAGKVNDLGTTYFITGSTGEKSYGVTENKDFNFDVTKTDFGSIYISVRATSTALTVTTYDGVTGLVVDTFVKGQNPIKECNHKYDYDGQMIYCTICFNHQLDPIASSYSGLVQGNSDMANNYYLFQNGNLSKDKFVVMGENYYGFDDNGVGLNGSFTFDGLTHIYKNGLIIGGASGFFRNQYGLIYLVNGIPLTGLERIEGEYYYFGDNGYALTGSFQIGNITYTGSIEEEYYGMLTYEKFMRSGNSLYYFHTYATYFRGWHNILGVDCYFSEGGQLQAISGDDIEPILFEVYKLYYESYKGSLVDFKAAKESGTLPSDLLPIFNYKDGFGQTHAATFLDDVATTSGLSGLDYRLLLGSNLVDQFDGSKTHLFKEQTLNIVGAAQEDIKRTHDAFIALAASISGKTSEYSSLQKLFNLRSEYVLLGGDQQVAADMQDKLRLLIDIYEAAVRTTNLDLLDAFGFESLAIGFSLFAALLAKRFCRGGK